MSGSFEVEGVHRLFLWRSVHTRRILSLLAIGLTFLSVFSTEAFAGELIRVVVRDAVSSVEISADASLLIKNAQGHVVYPGGTSRITVETAAEGVRVNGKPIQTDRIRIVSEKNDLRAAGQAFRGLIEVRNQDRGLMVINELDIEDYLKGVVPKEMAHDWHLESLKVQAVVARTYALYQKFYNRGRPFDLVSTVQDQVYEGVSQEKAETSLAIAQTDGLVVVHEGRLALTVYHSTSAGRTQDIREVWGNDVAYLRGVACPFDEDSPYFRWERKVSFQDFEQRLGTHDPQIGRVATLTPHARTSQGRVKEVRVLHSRGELFLQGEDLRRIVGYRILPSTQFELSSIGREIAIRGSGYGHGVGLCQWGAKVQAEQGRSFIDILKYYYPGVEITDYRLLSLGGAGSP